MNISVLGSGTGARLHRRASGASPARRLHDLSLEVEGLSRGLWCGNGKNRAASVWTAPLGLSTVSVVDLTVLIEPLGPWVVLVSVWLDLAVMRDGDPVVINQTLRD